MERYTGPKPRECGCKGVRTCLFCETNEISTSGTVKDSSDNSNQQPIPLAVETGVEKTKRAHKQFYFCPSCQKAYPHALISHQDHIVVEDCSSNCVSFPGIFVCSDFVTEEEEASLCDSIDQTAWMNSQSGRRKQDYGPKVNFKKKRVKTSVFTGLPAFSSTLVDRLLKVDLLSDFKPVELCNLEYVPERGSAIDPHFDDFWLWGERLVTLNLLCDTYLTFVKDSVPNVEVNVMMPRRGLLIVYGPARFEWKHAIYREEICGRRIAMTFRELTPEFLENGLRADVGKELIDIALSFEGTAVGSITPV